MGASPEQAQWTKKLATLLGEHRAALKTVKPSLYAADADGTLLPAGPGSVAGDPHAALADMLKATGRMRDPAAADPAAEQAQRREEHLREILLRDEHGLNAALIAAAAQPVPRATRVLARKPIVDGMPAPDRLAIENARKAMLDARAVEEAVQRDLLKRIADLVAGGMTELEAKNAALAAVAGGGPLSHHASRHGPQTTVSEQVTRVATGFAPDKPDAAPVADLAGQTTVDYVTRTGETVTIPRSRATGTEPSSAASWIGSGQAGLGMIEEALSQSLAARGYNLVNPAQRTVTELRAGARDEAFGKSAAPTKVGTNYVDAGGAQLPSANQLNQAGKTDIEKQDVIRRRAEAVNVDHDVRGAKVIAEVMQDDSARIVTAFPDVTVAARGFRLSTPANAPLVPLDLAAARVAARQAQVTAAGNAATQAEAEVGPATLDRDQKQLAFTQAVQQAQALRAAVPKEAQAALATLMGRAHTLAAAGAQLVAQTAARDATAAAIATLTAGLNAAPANLLALGAAHTAARNAADADDAARADKNLAKAERLAREQLAQAQALQARGTAELARLTTRHEQLVKDVAAATKGRDDAAAAQEAARLEAVAALPGDAGAKAAAAQQAIAAGAAMTATLAALDEAKSALELAQAAARQARADASELAQSWADAQAPSAGPDDAAVAAARKDQGDALAAALAGGPQALEAARKERADGIDALAASFADDKTRREALQAEDQLRGQQAVAAADALRKQLAAARKQLDARTKAAAPADQIAAAQAEVTRLATAVDAAAAQVKRMAAARSAFKAQAELQARAEAAGIAQARAALAAGVARAKADAAAGTPEADAAKLQAEALEADEQVAVLAARRIALTTAARAARQQRRIAELQQARHDATLLARQAELAAAPHPLLPPMLKLRDELLPNVHQPNKATSDAKVNALNLRCTQLQTEGEDCDRLLAAATKAAKAARAKLPA